jgi:Flp pilus assembly protein CpaB
MKKAGLKTLIVVAGGGLAVFLCVLVFLVSVRSTKPVVVAKAALPAGARLTAGYVEVREIPAAAVLPNALSDISQAEGQVLTIARAPGDQITADMLGDQATVGLANQIPPGHRAVAVHVDQASGLLGIIRPGDRVSVVAIVSPDAVGNMIQPLLPQMTEMAGTGEKVSGGTVITETQAAPSTVAYVTVTGLRVLLVPYSFRYQEVLPDEKTGMFSSAFTTAAAQQESVVLLEVPVNPVEINGTKVSPAALLPLLDAEAKLHLLLEPATDDGVRVTVGAELGDLYRAMTAYRTPRQ